MRVWQSEQWLRKILLTAVFHKKLKTEKGQEEWSKRKLLLLGVKNNQITDKSLESLNTTCLKQKTELRYRKGHYSYLKAHAEEKWGKKSLQEKNISPNREEAAMRFFYIDLVHYTYIHTYIASPTFHFSGTSFTTASKIKNLHSGCDFRLNISHNYLYFYPSLYCTCKVEFL